MVKQDDMETEYALCSLTEGKLECTPLDLYFRDETVTFAVSGQCEIHLSGHVIDDAGSDSDEGSEEESEEEEATANGALPAARCVVGQTRTVPLTAAASVSQAPRSHPRQMMTTMTRTIARRTTTRVRTLAVFLHASCPRCRRTYQDSIPPPPSDTKSRTALQMMSLTTRRLRPFRRVSAVVTMTRRRRTVTRRTTTVRRRRRTRRRSRIRLRSRRRRRRSRKRRSSSSSSSKSVPHLPVARARRRRLASS